MGSQWGRQNSGGSRDSFGSPESGVLSGKTNCLALDHFQSTGRVALLDQIEGCHLLAGVDMPFAFADETIRYSW
ncbi:hypothetical protein KOR42_54700 [Thalassoglobus neptunius]|uniref:Uncharacterized protein n=1 Tax=Thalassoglobus neptunius TaxID=1938619 RepID=A0A5C5UVY4_9PLAN|nr:hypothetical protein [Thalassoglobus neptunius]TWT30511.1 hypothetical protein KOR42_54700 [Thalassoglobus neptunius]